MLAVVNGVNIAPADLSEQTRAQVARLQDEVVQARKNEVNLQVNSILLEAEAKKRGVAAAKLLEDEVIAKTVNPTEAEALDYFNRNRTQIETQAGRRVEFSEIKENVIAFLRGEREQEQAKKFSAQLRAAAEVKILAPDVTPPASPADRARVFATVNGKNITSGDVEDSLRPLVFDVQEQVYTLRKRDLDLKINDILLEAEAQKRKLTTRALLDQEISSKPSIVTEADAQKFYNENKERINADFAQVKYQIIEFLEDQAKQKASADFAGRLRAAAAIQTFLIEPVSPVYEIATDDQPAKGAASATVTIVEFTDYQCPSCAQMHPVLERIMSEMSDRVRLVVRDYPLAQHANAFKAAEAAEAAREQGKYWEYTALLFRNQSALEVTNLKQYATALGLDRARFDAALDGGKFVGHVRRDILDGEKLGVSGTPSLFVNGRRVSNATYESLKAAIETALKNPTKK